VLTEAPTQKDAGVEEEETEMPSFEDEEVEEEEEPPKLKTPKRKTYPSILITNPRLLRSVEAMPNNEKTRRMLELIEHINENPEWITAHPVSGNLVIRGKEVHGVRPEKAISLATYKVPKSTTEPEYFREFLFALGRSGVDPDLIPFKQFKIAVQNPGIIGRGGVWNGVWFKY